MEFTKYKKTHERFAGFYQTRPRAAKILFFADKTATATVFLCYAVGFFALLLQKTPLFSWRFLRFFALPFSALLLVSLLRVLIKRKRPYENGLVPLFEKKKTGNSFPSRHSASAFSIGVSLLPVCLPCGLIAIVAGAAFFYTRFTLGWHYPSDLLCGGLLGGAIGALAFL